MSAPRRVLPGKTYLVTRRCYQRTFRLRPLDRTNQAFLYCLALAASKTEVVIHAVCVMSNHHHLVVTDVHGTLPVFLRELHRASAKALNASQGQWENLWSAEPANAVVLPEPEDIVRKIAYVVANPVDAGLVATPREWPGIILWGDERRLISRPRDYFDPAGPSPETLELVIAPPEVSLARDDWGQRVAAAIAASVATAQRAVKANALRFLGRAAVLAASFVARAKSYEAKRGAVPKVAAVNRDVRAALLAAYRRFFGAYRAALEEWRVGNRAAVFPPGTWWLRVHHGARIDAAA